jgi:hypothetical protein
MFWEACEITEQMKSPRMILSVVLVAAGFLIITVFFNFVPFSTSNRLTLWLWAMAAALTFGLAIFIILGLSIKKSVGAIIFVLFWSLIFFFPVPSSFQELIWAVWLFLLILIIAAYAKYQKSTRKP